MKQKAQRSPTQNDTKLTKNSPKESCAIIWREAKSKNVKALSRKSNTFTPAEFLVLNYTLSRFEIKQTSHLYATLPFQSKKSMKNRIQFKAHHPILQSTLPTQFYEENHRNI